MIYSMLSRMELRFAGRGLCLSYVPTYGLTDGIDRLINLAVSPGVKFKQSSMPFVQMENISHFLRACQTPPLSLPPHDVFLTVDLYEAKDPAQVLQCISAFSRRANAIQPSRFPRTIGGKSKGVVSPQVSGSNNSGFGAPAPSLPSRSRGASNVSNGSSTFNPAANNAQAARMSPTRTGGSQSGTPSSPGGPVSSWSRKADEGATAPAWNIHQYGYMGGASQGNQGIAFGARRQITSASPVVPSLADKERRRREKEAEDERLRVQAEEAENRRKIEREAEEERARIEEERRWEEETRKQRELERQTAEHEKRKWEEEERRWKEEEEHRSREEREAEARLEKERARKRAGSDARLKGQFLSQYQADQPRAPGGESDRIKELEEQLARAKEREAQYERERQERLRNHEREKPIQAEPQPREHRDSQDSWREDERDFLRKEWKTQNDGPPQPPRPLPVPGSRSTQQQQQQQQQAPPQPPRPLPVPSPSSTEQQAPPQPPRPLPNPSNYSSRTDRFLSSNPAPTPPAPATHVPREASTSSTAEASAETTRRLASQNATKAGGWASKSLLEREMERERERQREWEQAQKESKEAAAKGVGKDGKEGVGPGQSWDVNQYGYTGGDSQNRGGGGIGFGGRRQIIGPRPPP